jgi:thymidylate synthase
MRVIQGHDLATCHELTIKHIVKNAYRDDLGKRISFPGENKQATIECKELAIFCATPLKGQMFIPPPRLPFSEQFMRQYEHDLIYGTTADFVYDYHDRLFRHFKVNQIDYIIEKLKASPTSRRGVAITWNPMIDEPREDVPCLQLIHCDTRDGRFNMKVVFRSEDMLYGAGPNMYGLVSLQTWMGHKLLLPCGTYTHVVFCPHLYHIRDQEHLKNFVDLWW